MAAIRKLGLFAAALGLIVFAASSGSAQLPPGVKLPPQIKPKGNPGGVPGAPGGPAAPGKNPMPQPGGPPGNANLPGVGIPVPGGTATDPKRDPGNWPKEFDGKKLDDVIKEMRNADAAVREAAVRMLPVFGPPGREKGAEVLLNTLTRDQDINVRMAALAVAPTVFLGYADGPDQIVTEGLGGIMANLNNESSHFRLAAVASVQAIGPYMKREKPDIIQKLAYRAREQGSWQLRRAAVGAIASVGQGSPPPMAGAKGIDPDKQAVTVLLEVLQRDTCALVRRSAIEALITIGPVGASQQAEWKRSLDHVFRVKAEKDKTNLLWVHVLLVRNSPTGVKGNEDHLDAVAQTLKSDDPLLRLEACSAMGALGEDAVSKLDGLLNLIRDAKQPPQVVAAAMVAVTSMKSQDKVIMPVLQNVAATHPDMDVRKYAQEAITALQKK